MDYAPKGDLSDFDAFDIADGAEWEGDPEEFIQALLTCGPAGRTGFLEKTPDGRLLIHDWWQYGGKLIVKRWVDAFRKRNNGRIPTLAEKQAANLPLPPADVIIEEDADNASSASASNTGAANASTTGNSRPAHGAAKPAASGGRTDTKRSSAVPPSEGAFPSVEPPSERAGREAERSVTERSVEQQNETKRSVEDSNRAKRERRAPMDGDSGDDPPVVAVSSQGEGEKGFDALPGQPGQLSFPGDSTLSASDDASGSSNLVRRLVAAGMNRSVAEELALKKPDECEKQLGYVVHVKAFKTSRGAYLADAIRNGYGPPKGYEESVRANEEAAIALRQSNLRQAQERERGEARRDEDERYQALLATAQADPNRWESIQAEAREGMPPQLLAKLDDGVGFVQISFENKIREIVLKGSALPETAGVVPV